MPRRRTLAAASGLCLLGFGAGDAWAQGMPGLAGSTVGLPANPFASNYPSEPPPAMRPAPRERVIVRRSHRQRGVAQEAPLPPAEVPYR
ncbi:hypothetical protein [Methylobacterium organophilum]|uniref:Uncharacterized protein n=1 Tax=Methylobacterium organophilum TaxID=410 RepID=A0ABQ4T4Z5_METOR|nr:hypothetical protein [Methylobacterium organophilum]GJE25311.1 hypothetical protein LKMONMHP_0146 [Methylobacterium organophilum]